MFLTVPYLLVRKPHQDFRPCYAQVRLWLFMKVSEKRQSVLDNWASHVSIATILVCSCFSSVKVSSAAYAEANRVCFQKYHY